MSTQARVYSQIVSGTDTSSFHVVVIGAGLGGLAIALALQRNRVKCVVYERDNKLTDRRQGYGMTLTNNPKGPLAALVGYHIFLYLSQLV